MPNDNEGTLHQEDQAATKRPWQTPNLEELDVQDTANGFPPITGPGDGVNAYS